MDNENMPTVEDMQAAFGIEPTGESDPPENQDTETPPVGQESEQPTESNTDNNPPDGEPENQENNQEDPAQQQQQQADPRVVKQQQAFARMRTENAMMQKTIAAIATALGLDVNQPIEQLNAQLQSQATGAIAKANNMDPAILNRLDQLEAINAEYTRNKLAQEVEGSLLNIQSKYGASEGDLEVFVNELLEEGYDVSKSGSNLELEFLRRNFDKIKAREIDNAVRAEQERSAKASGASKPANKQGQEDNTTEHEINTVEDLNNFFNETMK